jgi:hypothetical protein
MFLLPNIDLEFRPRILDLKPGTRVVSNTFTMEEWTANETVTVEGDDCGNYYKAHLWIVPAKVEGTWKLLQGELTLKRSFQRGKPSSPPLGIFFLSPRQAKGGRDGFLKR